MGIKGLKGGHSGMDINLGRGNSNKLLFRFLKTYAAELGIRIASVSGGTLRNAIPRESFALVVIPAANETKLQAAIKEAEGIYKAELSAKEPTLQVTAEACGATGLRNRRMYPVPSDQFHSGLPERSCHG